VYRRIGRVAATAAAIIVLFALVSTVTPLLARLPLRGAASPGTAVSPPVATPSPSPAVNAASLTLATSDVPGYVLVTQGPAHSADGQQSPSSWDVVYRRPDGSTAPARVVESIAVVYASIQDAEQALNDVGGTEAAAHAVALPKASLPPTVNDSAAWREGPSPQGTVVRVAAVQGRMLIVVGVLSDRLDAASATAYADVTTLLQRAGSGS
jgi:hypothetical protein